METKLSEMHIHASMNERFNEILTDEALEFLRHLHENFNEKRKQLLENRKTIQEKINQGERPDFLKETADIRSSEWTIAPIPNDLKDRRVEITGPVDRKMVINGLNSGAKVFMADFEDANSPTWSNIIHGQLNLKDAINRTILYENNRGKVYELNEDVAVLKVRPRGWHLEEKHISYKQEHLSGSLVDFGLYFYHNAKRLIGNGSGPYFYLPKLENHQEARLWNEVFVFAQEYMNIPQGTIKATVLIETILAAFEMDEILYELKEHSAGLNCGRWDYIFSYLKKFRNDKHMLLPDRADVTMTVPFMRAYSLLTIQTCHRRNAHAMGGMAAQIPVKNDSTKNEAAYEKVRADKEREVKDGHDGTWVAHPAMVRTAMDIFDKHMPGENQLNRKHSSQNFNADQLLEVPKGVITEQGLRTNINVGIQYIASWLDGKGAAPIHHLMEDAATAEISRAQVWQWIRHPEGKLEDDRDITMELYAGLKEEELEAIRGEVGQEVFENGPYQEAARLFDKLIRNDDFAEFLTLEAYNELP
ncbi:malate synthase [Halobacillus dabanensis]|uniref:Malate synthase n=1 Tax=Halobacillus dabanensis TaxID=240302 RepID=A0A1I3R8S2_HALDA|nr:malate synthase A [Halobacillus dabanensis]SFJ42545.1 malate synthase [Halobacillus dabanensis]